MRNAAGSITRMKSHEPRVLGTRTLLRETRRVRFSSSGYRPNCQTHWNPALSQFDGPVLKEAVSNQAKEGAAMTTLHGWQRIWLLAAILWAVVILLLSGILQPDRDQTVQSVLFVVRLWIVPVVAVYGFGLGLAWVRRGFQVESK